MENLESKNKSQEIQQETEQERRARLISRYIAKIINNNESVSKEEEKEITEYYSTMNPREKANTLYSKVMAYMADKQAEQEMKEEAEKNEEEEFIFEKVDPYLISEIKVLSNDETVTKLLPETYGEARIDTKTFQLSDLGNLWEKTNKEIFEKRKEYKQLEQKIHLNKISGKGKLSSSKSHMARLAENLTSLEERKNNLETLQGFTETSENTDSVAQFQYENLKEYKKQLDEGFVWLPSRKEIHQETISAILNHRWPVLIGEAGSGKSDQADAAAIELTGHPPTNVACSSKTGEKDLIKDLAVDPETGGSYEVYGPLMRALTGYEDSRKSEPKFKTGRIVRFDEAYRIPHDSSGYSIIKEARQLKPGDLFYGKPVLPGSGAIWTTNPPGPRYPNRYPPDAALRRELAENFVDYPEMSDEKPELYEFALTTLFDENNHIAIAGQELAPKYVKKEISEDQREILENGDIVIAKDEIVENMADAQHGALWRFCGAIKSLQESFVFGNTETEEYPDTVLRFKEDADGNIEVTTDGSGELLTLSTSTVTLGELASWMSGFNERKQKQNKEFRVDTLTEWLNFKINTYIKQTDKADKEKIRAIFKHFYFLEDNIPDISQAKPLTPKEIGYLSPRVPRPVYLKKPQTNKENKEKEILEADTEVKEYETKQILLEDGTEILIKESDFNIGDGENQTLVHIGEKFMQNNESFIFTGIIKDESNEHDGNPVGQLASGEKLYKIFSSEELDMGIIEEFKNFIGETGINDMKENFINYWKIEGCEEKSGEFVF
jgi:hypothetical protein